MIYCANSMSARFTFISSSGAHKLIKVGSGFGAESHFGAFTKKLQFRAESAIDDESIGDGIERRFTLCLCIVTGRPPTVNTNSRNQELLIMNSMPDYRFTTWRI